MSKYLFLEQREQEQPGAAPLTERQWIAYSGFSKEKNKAIADTIIAACEEGNIDPLDAYLLAKSMENTNKLIMDGIKDMALTEAYKYSQKSFTHRGCDINIKEQGVKYDYANCNDAVWNGLQAEMEALKAKIKERETFLKTIKEPMTIASESTDGELLHINPPIKSSTTGLTITIK